jgi:enoyl-CoA hydratase
MGADHGMVDRRCAVVLVALLLFPVVVVRALARAEELDARVMEFAQRLANGATKSINWTKQIANIGLRQVAAGLMDASIAYEALSSISKDHAEAVKAFLEKRKPQFNGE